MLANLNSIPLDVVARQKVSGINMSFYFINQFPVLPPDFYTDAHLAFIVHRVIELTYTSHAMLPFARDLAYEGPHFPWDEDRRAWVRAEIEKYRAEQGATILSVVMELDRRRISIADGTPFTAEYRMLDYDAFLSKAPVVRATEMLF